MKIDKELNKLFRQRYCKPSQYRKEMESGMIVSICVLISMLGAIVFLVTRMFN